MIITDIGYIINFNKRESLQLICSLDNTIIDDRSYTTETLPKFLRIINESNKNRVIVHDFLKEIKSIDSLKQVYNKSLPYKLTILQIVLSYLHVNKADYMVSLDYFNMVILDKINQNFSVEESSDKITISRKDYDMLVDLDSVSINQIQADILSYKRENKDFIQNIFPIMSMNPLPSSNFFKNEENINLVFDKNISLNLLFDTIICSRFFPICIFNKYVKVHSSLDKSKIIDWIRIKYEKLSIKQLIKIAKSKQIILQRNNKKGEIISKIKKYDEENNIFNLKQNEIVIHNLINKKYDKENKKTSLDMYDKITISIKDNKLIVNCNTNNENKSYLVNMLLSLLKLNNTRYNKQNLHYNGKMFFLLDELPYINFSIFSHICMQKQYYIVINEFMNASTQSSTLKLQYLYYTNIDSSIRNNVVNNSNRDNTFLNKYNNGKNFIEINILKCDSDEKLQFFSQDLGIMLRIYLNEYKTIQEEYNTLYTKLNMTFNYDKNAPEILIYNKDDITKLVNAKYKDRTLEKSFVKVCGPEERKSAIQIISLSDSSLNEFTKIHPDFNDYFYKKPGDNTQYMLWPKDDIDSYLLYCDDKKLNKYNYPGVTKGTNFPCCFKDDQIFGNRKEDHKPSIQSYYYNIEQSTDKQSSYNIKGPKKLLDSGKKGDILPNIQLIAGKEAKRNGIQISNRSFFECVKNSIQSQNIEIPTDTSKIWETFIITSKQSNYDISLEKINSNITDIVLDCRYFTTVFEYLFNVYIFTFDINGNLITPRFKDCYLDFYHSSRNNIVFLFENINNNGDKQYEYLTNTLKEVNIDSILGYRYSFYNIDKKVLPVMMYPFEIVSQYIDNFGKCRVIEIVHNNYNIFAQVFLPPIPIHYNNILKDTLVRSVPLVIFTKFIQTFNIEILSQCVIDTKELEVYTKISSDNINASSIYLTFIVSTQQTYNKIPIHKPRKIINYKNNIYDNFIKTQQISESLQQFTLYLFSKSNLSIDDFFTKQVTLTKNHEYNINKSFSNNTFIDRNNKLIISADKQSDRLEIVKRLKSYLILYRKRFNNKLSLYKENTSIDTLYYTISDFQVYSENDIYILNNIQVKRNKDIVIYPTSFNNYSYFISINNKIFLTCDTYSLSNSIYISNNWKIQEYQLIHSDKFSPVKDYRIIDINFNILIEKGEKIHTILHRKYNNISIFSPLL